MINAEQVNQYFNEQARTSGVPLDELRKFTAEDFNGSDRLEWEKFRYNFDLILHEERNKGGVYG